jgi:hypothetical protein
MRGSRGDRNACASMRQPSPVMALPHAPAPFSRPAGSARHWRPYQVGTARPCGLGTGSRLLVHSPAAQVPTMQVCHCLQTSAARLGYRSAATEATPGGPAPSSDAGTSSAGKCTLGDALHDAPGNAWQTGRLLVFALGMRLSHLTTHPSNWQFHHPLPARRPAASSRARRTQRGSRSVRVCWRQGRRWRRC